MAIYPSVNNFGYDPYGVRPDMYRVPGYAVPQQIFVDGIEGAKAYQMPCNSQGVLWDSTLPLFYIKRVDAQGRPSIIRTCQYDDFVEKKADSEAPSVDMANYVTTDQLKDYISSVIKELSVGPQGRIVRGPPHQLQYHTAGIKDLDTIQGMEDRQSNRNGEYWRPDRYSEKRYYSRDDGRSRMSEEIERLMEDAPNEEVRQALHRVLTELK